jgi:hypothetical protein
MAALAVAACEGTPGPNPPDGAYGNAPNASNAPGASNAGGAQSAEGAPPLSSLSGQNRAQVMALLGAPRFKRQDNPAEIWQYRSPGCFLDIFLYREKGGDAYRVRHFETRGGGKKTVSETDCFAGLIKSHQTGKSG